MNSTKSTHTLPLLRSIHDSYSGLPLDHTKGASALI